jgi:hypothetical protein
MYRRHLNVIPNKIRGRALPAAAVALAAGGAVFAATGAADSSFSPDFAGVPAANQKAAGYAPASVLTQELQQLTVAHGSTPLENPDGIVGWYGYQNDVPSADNPALPQMVPTPTSATEAQKTEPDKNTYLVLKGQKGADPNYDYGTHFLFQAHENAAKDAQGNKLGYITRINLDADPAHRVTLLADKDVHGATLVSQDGTTWDPFAQRLIVTTENQNGPTYAATAGFPSSVEDVSGALGRGGYEGVQNDSAGNLWIVEDIGGSGKGGTAAKVPNSFVYRYVPSRPGDLHNGKLQALQVLNTGGQPITLASQTALNAPDQLLLHSYGHELTTKWVTVHDTAVDGTTPFNANVAAKKVDATPFKRPENGQFRPDSKFREFYFDETGDTNATSPENGDPATGAGGAGGWGAVQQLVQSSPSADTGKLKLFFQGNKAHSGFDNVAFLSKDRLTFVEDAGDTLHAQRNALDSGFVFSTTTDYSNTANQPVRWLAEGRDPSATLDSAGSGYGKNDGDNEITGVHVSDGDPSAAGLLGAKSPKLFQQGWRWFYTQQHGDNPTFEVIPTPRAAESAQR